MILSVYTDGGSKGNPGPAAIGVVAYADGNEVFRYREDIGKATNNVAEYRAVLTAMSKLKTQMSKLNKVTRIDFYSDSRLMVNQLNGHFKVKSSNIQDLIFKIREQELVLGLPVVFYYIPREENRVADNLVNSKRF
ncbi:MAG: ribonuclease HI family protein [Candidatus Paceibacterota bacterium]